MSGATTTPSNCGLPTTSDGTDLDLRDLTIPIVMSVVTRRSPINAPVTIPPMAPFDNERQLLPLEIVIVEVKNTKLGALPLVILMVDVAERDVEVGPRTGTLEEAVNVIVAGMENLPN